VTGRIETITAPNGAGTTLSRDDFDRPADETSNDRGHTVYATDPAGNVTALTDARGITASYNFDALNRVIGVSYPNTAENVSYVYDSCSNGVGRLCRITDATGTTDLAYDAFGNVITHTRNELGVVYITRYAFDAGNRVLTVTTPGGKVVTYSRNAVGRILGISTTLNSTATTIVSGRTYRSDGLVKNQIFGNGVVESRLWNLRGELQSQTIGTLDSRTYGFDANGNRISLITSTANTVFSYDVLDRLNGVGATSLSYDPNGNRTSDNRGTYSYQASSNRLSTIPEGSLNLDPAGNTSSDGLGRTFTYANAGTLSSVSLFGTTVGTYSYDFRNLRSRKTSAAATTVFSRDFGGRIIAESDGSGGTLRTYIWDDGYQPIAQIDNIAGTERITYLHTDPLGTPVLGTDSTGKIVWKAPADPFGAGAPSEDPDIAASVR
jgi:YD repeat-containing protein